MKNIVAEEKEYKTFNEIMLEANQAYIEATTHVDPKTGKRYLNEIPTRLVVSSELYKFFSGENAEKEEG